MAKAKLTSAERLADHFISYLFDQYQGTKHVRRVASWIGFLLKGIENLPSPDLRKNRLRQVMFDYRNHTFKVRYNHALGSRGGIEFVEVLPGKGQPEGSVALHVANLTEAETAYKNLKRQLDTFIKTHP